MEILRRGTPPGERIYLGTCSNCTTQVRFKGAEAKCSSDQRDGTMHFVTCPVCQSTIYGTIEQRPTNSLDWRNR